MTHALFVGGPWHGRMVSVGTPLPSSLMVPVPASIEITIESIINPIGEALPSPVSYHLRRFVHEVDLDNRPIERPAYVNSGTELWGQGARHAGVTSHDLALADGLLMSLHRDALPVCVVPACSEKAPMLFVADERGRLAGRDWKPGDEIRLCRPHGSDVYRVQGTHGRERLAEWLRDDVNLDAMDAYDAGHDLLFGDQIRELRARALRVSREKI